MITRLRLPSDFLGSGSFKTAYSLTNIYISLNESIDVRIKWKALLCDKGDIHMLRHGADKQEEIRELLGADVRIVRPTKWLPIFRYKANKRDRLAGYTRWYNGDFSQATSLVGVRRNFQDSVCTKISFQDSLQVLCDVAATMLEMHEKGVVHADLKSLDVFVSNAEADGKFHGYVADFDFAERMAGESHNQPSVINDQIGDYFARDFLGKRGLFTPDADIKGYANIIGDALMPGFMSRFTCNIPEIAANPKFFWLKLSSRYASQLPKGLPEPFAKKCKEYMKKNGCDANFFQMCLKEYPLLPNDQKKAFLTFIRHKQACYTLWNALISVYQADEKRNAYVREHAVELRLTDAVDISRFGKMYDRMKLKPTAEFEEWLLDRTGSLLDVCHAVPLPKMREIQTKVQRAMAYLSMPYSPTEVKT